MGIYSDYVDDMFDILTGQLGRSVVYRRGSASVVVSAIVTQVEGEIVGTPTMLRDRRTRLFRIKTSALVLSGSPIEPRPGDLIDDGDQGCWEVVTGSGATTAKGEQEGVWWRIQTQEE